MAGSREAHGEHPSPAPLQLMETGVLQTYSMNSKRKDMGADIGEGNATKQKSVKKSAFH